MQQGSGHYIETTPAIAYPASSFVLFFAARRGRLEYSKIKIITVTQKEKTMCRNIKTLFNFDPPATDDEIQAASLQFVRKLTGCNEPSKANEEAFNRAIKDVAVVARNLLDSLVTNTGPRNREVEIERARARAAKRFGTGSD
jgi:hypothetical protein